MVDVNQVLTLLTELLNLTDGSLYEVDINAKQVNLSGSLLPISVNDIQFTEKYFFTEQTIHQMFTDNRYYIVCNGRKYNLLSLMGSNPYFDNCFHLIKKAIGNKPLPDSLKYHVDNYVGKDKDEYLDYFSKHEQTVQSQLNEINQSISDIKSTLNKILKQLPISEFS